MFVALSFNACVKGGSFSSNNDMKKQRKEKGVTDLIRQFKTSRIRSSIRWILGASKMNPSSFCYIYIFLFCMRFITRHYQSKLKTCFFCFVYLEIRGRKTYFHHLCSQRNASYHKKPQNPWITLLQNFQHELLDYC